MKRWVMAIAVLAAGSAGAQGESWFNKEAKLQAYPGASDVRVKEKGRDTEVHFKSTDPVDEVYAHHERALTEAGWKRTEFEQEKNEIEGTYQREGQTVKLELELEDPKQQRYKLEVDFKG